MMHESHQLKNNREFDGNKFFEVDEERHQEPKQFVGRLSFNRN